MSEATERRGLDWPARARIWIVLDTAAAAPRSVIEIAERAIAGGVDAVVCRLKELPATALAPLARKVRQICAAGATPFVLSHQPQLAVELGAEAVHLGHADPPVPDVRAIVGPTMSIGYSSHSIAEANAQLAAGADYVFFGPVFPTPTKLKYGAPLGLAKVRRAVTEVAGTVVYIGGINQTNLKELRGCGVERVAAINALQHDCEPAEAVAAFRRIMSGAG